MDPDHQNGIVEHVSTVDVVQTLDKLRQAIAKAGLIVFAEIDHAAGARNAGLEMPSATVVVYGHPKGGTPLMLAAPLVALDLPLRVLVRQRDDGRAAVAFRPIAAVLRQAGVPDAMASRLDPAQNLILTALRS